MKLAKHTIFSIEFGTNKNGTKIKLLFNFRYSQRRQNVVIIDQNQIRHKAESTLTHSAKIINFLDEKQKQHRKTSV